MSHVSPTVQLGDSPSVTLTHRCWLSSLPTSVASLSVGAFLSDREANKWAQCSRHSHATLQQYVFKRTAPIPRMLLLHHSSHRTRISFGRISRVSIETAEEWTQHFSSLPTSVRNVTISITAMELNAVYPAIEMDSRISSVQCGENDPAVGSGSSKITKPNPMVVLPAKVEEFHVTDCSEPMERWLNHLQLPIDSSLRVLRLGGIGRNWSSLPQFVRHSLPDTLVELHLPLFGPFGFRNETDSMQPSAEYYPSHWPPHLTRLSLCCNPSSPFATGVLPPLPPTLTELAFGLLAENPSLQQMVENLPDSIRFLYCPVSESIDPTCKLPASLQCLHVGTLQIADENPQLDKDHQYAFPPSLQELRLAQFTQPQFLASILPDTITILDMDCANVVERPSTRKGMQWSTRLKSWMSSWWKTSPTPSLRDWNPPPLLTELSLHGLIGSLDGVSLPISLRTLKLRNYTHSLANVEFPPMLSQIVFRGVKWPNLKAGMWHPPPGLTSLACAFQEDMYIPASVRRFSVRDLPPPSHACFERMGLPRELEELELRRINIRYEEEPPSLDNLVLPPKLRCLRLDDSLLSDDVLRSSSSSSSSSSQGMLMPLRSNQIPSSLTEFWVIGEISSDKYDQIAAWAGTTLPPQCCFCVEPSRDSPLL